MREGYHEFENLSPEQIEAIKSLAKIAKSLVESYTEATKILYNCLWDKYEEFGFPYGKTHAGLVKWLEDKG